MHGKYKSSFSKFRCGVARMKIETGRYENLCMEERTFLIVVLVLKMKSMCYWNVLYKPIYVMKWMFSPCLLYLWWFYEHVWWSKKNIFMFCNDVMQFYTTKICHNLLLKRISMASQSGQQWAFSNIKKWFFNITNSFSNVTNWISYITKHFFDSKNHFLILKIQLNF